MPTLDIKCTKCKHPRPDTLVKDTRTGPFPKCEECGAPTEPLPWEERSLRRYDPSYSNASSLRFHFNYED